MPIIRSLWHRTSSWLRLGGVRAPAAAAGLALAFGVAAPASSADPLVSTSPSAVGVGFNGNGELGDGTTISSDVAVRVTAPDAVTAVAAGGYHSLGLLNTGKVMSWGYNGYGELGDGTTANSEVPVEVPGLNGVTAISAGEFHSLALLGAGTVMAWGANNDGQLGDGTTSNSDTPVEVRGLTGVAAVSAGGCGPFPEGHSLALLTTGRVMAWGGNQYGQLGNGTTSGSDVPVEVPGLREVVAVSAGEFFSLALLKNGRVMAWGRNNLGQLGGGTTSPAIDVPVEVTELAGVTAISAGGCGGSSEGHSLALLSNGAVMAWGYNGSGELGNGTTANSDVPVKVRGLAGVTAVSAGTSHSVALRQNGTVAAWGANYSGQLGDGSTTRSDIPVAMTELSGVTAISAGGFHTLAVLSPPTTSPAPLPPAPILPPPVPVPPPPTGGTQPNVIIGVNDGSGWGNQDAEQFVAGGIKSERTGSAGQDEYSRSLGFRNDTVIVGNTSDGSPLSSVSTASWTASALAEVRAAVANGYPLDEVGNEMSLKGNGNGNGEPAKYAEMFMSLANAVDASGIKGVKLLFSSDGDYQRPDKTWSQMCCGGGWVADALKAEPELLARVDGFVSHPYGRAHTDTPEHDGPGGMEDQHANVVALGFEHTDYYLTEYGVQWTPGKEGPINAPTQALQAAWIREAYEEFVALPYVRGIWYYQTHDDSSGKWGLIEPQSSGSSPFVPREALGVIEGFAKADG